MCRHFGFDYICFDVSKRQALHFEFALSFDSKWKNNLIFALQQKKNIRNKKMKDEEVEMGNSFQSEKREIPPISLTTIQNILYVTWGTLMLFSFFICRSGIFACGKSHEMKISLKNSLPYGNPPTPCEYFHRDVLFFWGNTSSLIEIS